MSESYNMLEKLAYSRIHRLAPVLVERFCMANIPAPLDLTVQITTPENIRFEYRLAGPFRRLPALLLDFIFRCATIFGIFLLCLFLGVFNSFLFESNIATVIIMLSYFLLTWFYGLFFESWMNGQTPGKKITGIRVMSIDGMPINAVQATIRNFLRVADTAPLLSLEVFSSDAPPAYVIPTFGVALICMVLTSRMQRLGDLAAGTMVVIDERSWFPKHAKFEDPRVASLAEYIPPNFRVTRGMTQTIALFVDRRNMLSGPRRAELAAILGGPLNRIFGFRPDTSPDLTICALYYREFYAAKDQGRTDKLVLQPPENPRRIAPSQSPLLTPEMVNFGSKLTEPPIAAATGIAPETIIEKVGNEVEDENR